MLCTSTQWPRQKWGNIWRD